MTLTKGFFYYSSGDIELLEIDSFFTKDSLLDVMFGDFELGQVNFWFGGRNVTAYTHYDTSHNLHTIIRGRKKFLLFPPSAHKHLKLYPSLHTFYRQVQVDILNLTQAQFRELLFETPFPRSRANTRRDTVHPSILVPLCSDPGAYHLTQRLEPE
ncbi:hypothetical protein GBAR_LOCUS10066 [Geodia barretti]|uniref:Cupin-like domain-containing protein n=1 Tax=Geodia barretti TaxID=519541 RepID=A0AA35RU31_GEOBA|nr:hypothetical protein GBAR_LOCUS10066 [Geodia barretti]